MSASKLDAVYRSFLLTKFFTKGWGKAEDFHRLLKFRRIVSNRETCYKLIPADYPITITKEEKRSDCLLLEGHFKTPLENYLPGVVPTCVQPAHFQIVMPLEWQHSDYKPMCLHLAGTGDHYFWRRRNLMAKPLLKEAGIGSIILENPFYGLRKPQDQVRSSLHTVSDIFVMGGCLILEALVLFNWCEQNGFGPLGVTGLSMGGHMASLAATNWPKPLVLVPCLSWSTASSVFTQGVMSNSINWELLETQFYSDGEYKNNLSKMVTIVDEAFLAGRKFAQRYSNNSNSNSFDQSTLLNNYNCSNFDITNPGASSCQEMCLDTNKNYNSENKEAVNMNALDILKDNKSISENLYKKITSKEKFDLEQSEINELNELANKSFNNKSKCYKDNEISSVSSIEVKNVTSVFTKINNSENISDNILNTSDNSNENSITKIKDNQLIILKPNDTSEDSDKNSSNSIANLMSYIPFLTKLKEDPLDKSRNREALQFMRGVMDECTHIGNFSVPYDTSLIIAVCAKHDAYVPRGNSGGLEELWPGMEVRYVDAGHVSAYVWYQSLFRSCIIEAFEKSKKKWLKDKKISD